MENLFDYMQKKEKIIICELLQVWEVKLQAANCMSNNLTCFNCEEWGHVSTRCEKPKKDQSEGKVFALSRAEDTALDNLIRGTCFINNILLITNIDMGATHSFISVECVSRLNLEVSATNSSMVIDTPTNDSVTTLLVCLNSLLTIFGRDFGIDLVCLPLSQLDVILEMN